MLLTVGLVKGDRRISFELLRLFNPDTQHYYTPEELSDAFSNRYSQLLEIDNAMKKEGKDLITASCNLICQQAFNIAFEKAPNYAMGIAYSIKESFLRKDKKGLGACREFLAEDLKDMVEACLLMWHDALRYMSKWNSNIPASYCSSCYDKYSFQPGKKAAYHPDGYYICKDCAHKALKIPQRNR